MKIVFVSHSFYPRKGGVETVLLNLARCLSKKGHNISIIANHYPSDLPVKERMDGFDVSRLPLAIGVGNVRATIASLRNITLELGRLILLLQKCSPDVLNIHFISLGHALLSILAARFLRIPVVATVHGSDITYLPQKVYLCRCIVRWVLQSAQATTFTSNFINDAASHLVRRKKGIFRTIRNGVDLFRFNNEAKKGNYILAIGRIAPEKGFDYLIPAYKKLVDAGRSEQLLIAGDGTERNKCEQIVADLGLQGRIRFEGWAEEDKIADLISGCKFLVVPSLREGLGIVCLEAMAARKAIIATKVGGIPEIVEDGVNGLLVESKNPQRLAESMLWLLENEKACRQMGEAGRKIVERHYTWEKVTEKYVGIYHEAIERYHSQR